MLIREFCAENLTHLEKAINAGVERVELCDNLAVGGTTPSAGVMRHAIKYCHEHGVKVACMIRPRGGDFAYSVLETRAMREDIVAAYEADADGVVFGCVKDGHLDTARIEGLLELSEGLEVTFHRAFDEIDFAERFKAIDWLCEHGVARILTHGSNEDNPIEDNIEALRTYARHAHRRITIVPAGGLTWKNARKIAIELGVHEVHGREQIINGLVL